MDRNFVSIYFFRIVSSNRSPASASERRVEQSDGGKSAIRYANGPNHRRLTFGGLLTGLSASLKCLHEGGNLLSGSKDSEARDALKESPEVTRVRDVPSVTPTRCWDVNDWEFSIPSFRVQFARATCAECALQAWLRRKVEKFEKKVRTLRSMARNNFDVRTS